MLLPTLMTIHEVINMDIEALESMSTKDLETLLQPLITQSRTPLTKTGTALKKAREANTMDILRKAEAILKQPTLL